jgi:hypothetical protein
MTAIAQGGQMTSPGKIEPARSPDCVGVLVSGSGRGLSRLGRGLSRLGRPVSANLEGRSLSVKGGDGFESVAYSLLAAVLA